MHEMNLDSLNSITGGMRGILSGHRRIDGIILSDEDKKKLEELEKRCFTEQSVFKNASALLNLHREIELTMKPDFTLHAYHRLTSCVWRDEEQNNVLYLGMAFHRRNAAGVFS